MVLVKAALEVGEWTAVEVIFMTMMQAAGTVVAVIDRSIDLSLRTI
ncbi:MAG: hypothetical protein O3A78_00085 [Nitrospinae bacterium]|nr:hypothetical protein [Nitrospinota bacterium]MDA1108205.1 hypothetical protein [Nitrospinota bacterium]